jgi:BolA protein
MSDGATVQQNIELGPVGRQMAAKIEAAFEPAALELRDDSQKHAKHAHVMARAGTAAGVGETHFWIKIVSSAFHGKSRIDRHRMVNGLLAEELAGSVHALALEVRTPEEV